jgi:hypothetical protein
MKVYGIGLREKNGIVSMDCPEKLLRKLGENQFANGDRETRKQSVDGELNGCEEAHKSQNHKT